MTITNRRPIIAITRIQQGRKLVLRTIRILAALYASACGSSPSSPSSTPPTPTGPARWMLSGLVVTAAGGALSGAIVTVLDGPDPRRQATTDSSGRYALAGLQEAGFNVQASARSYTAVIKGINLTANIQADFVLPLPLGRLVDVGGSDIRYDRVPGGFEMYAMALNDGPGCVNSVSGVITIRSTAPPNLTIDFTWSLPADRIVQPGERFTYHVGTMTDEQAFRFPAGTASTKFSGFSIPCP